MFTGAFQHAWPEVFCGVPNCILLCRIDTLKALMVEEKDTRSLLSKLHGKGQPPAEGAQAEGPTDGAQ